jgi:hypothetical protein
VIFFSKFIKYLRTYKQTVPLTAGISAAVSGVPLVPLKPNSTDCPGPMVLFHERGSALKLLFNTAFHTWVIDEPSE